MAFKAAAFADSEHGTVISALPRVWAVCYSIWLPGKLCKANLFCADFHSVIPRALKFTKVFSENTSKGWGREIQMVWPARPCSSRAAPGLRDSSMLDMLWLHAVELRVFCLLGALSVTQRKLFLPHLEMCRVHAAVALLSFCLVFTVFWRTSLRISLHQCGCL